MALQRPRGVSTPASAEINYLPRWSSGRKEGETTDLEGLGWVGFDRTGWVRKKRRASPPRPSCSMARIETSWAPTVLRDSPRFISDPWMPGALDEGRVFDPQKGAAALVETAGAWLPQALRI